LIEKQKLITKKLITMSFEPYFSTVIHSLYSNRSWGNVKVTQQKDIAQEPSEHVKHYGQGIFEGGKATKIKVGNGLSSGTREVVLVFALMMHFLRYNRGMVRLGMPEVSEQMFIQSVEEFIQAIWDQIPIGQNKYLYLRPHGTSLGELDPAQRSPGVFGNENFSFTILGSPLHTEPFVRLKIYLELTLKRAGKGGTGLVKAIGNYAASLGPEKTARELGCDQVLWLNEDNTIQEFTTATFFMIKDGKLITPSLDCGTILEGMTRHHILILARQRPDLVVEERPITLSELIQGLEDGSIDEIYTAGTAVTTHGCESIQIGEKVYTLPNKGVNSWANYFFTAMGKAYRGELNAQWVHTIERSVALAH
jgi:branched-chain amino acid aminotransferase